MQTDSLCSPDTLRSFESISNELGTLQAEEARGIESLQTSDSTVGIRSPTQREASPVEMETGSLPDETAGESQLDTSLPEAIEIDFHSEVSVQAFSPCYPDNTQLSVISSGAVETLSQSTDTDSPDVIQAPTTRSRAKLASNIQSDLLSTRNKQISPIASPTKQLIPIISPSEQLSPVASPTKQLTPLISSNEQLSPMASPTKQLIPIISPTKQLLPFVSPTKQLTPIFSPDKQLITNSFPTAMPNKQLSVPRRSPRLTTAPDTMSPVQAGVFHLPAARTPTASPRPSQPNPHIGINTKLATFSRQPVSAPTVERQKMPAALVPVRKICTSINIPAIPGPSHTTRTKSVKRKRRCKVRKSKTQCLHSLERDRQSKPAYSSLITERRVIELPKLPPKGSRQLTKCPSSSKILSEYLRETSKPKQSSDMDKEFSQMRTKKVSNLLALSEDQQELGRALSAGETGEEEGERGVGPSEGESDVEMGMGPTKRVVGRGRQRRRIKSKVYISESEEYYSDSSPPPPPPETPTYTDIALREEIVEFESEHIVCDSISLVRDPSQLSRVCDTRVCLELERMRTLFSIPVTRARSKLARPAYSLDSLGFYDVTPALSRHDIIRIKEEFSPGPCSSGMVPVPDDEMVDLTNTELSTLSSPAPSPPSEEDRYMSPAASPSSTSSCSSFNTPRSDSTKRHSANRSSSPLLSHSDQPALPSEAPAETRPVSVRTTRSGNEYRSYLTTDFSNEESPLPFANFLSQAVLPTDSPQQPDSITSSQLVGEAPMDCSAPIATSEQAYIGPTESATTQVNSNLISETGC